MAVQVRDGGRFDGVVFDTAHGAGRGYVIGNQTDNQEDMLTVDPDKTGLIGVKYFHHCAGDARKPAQEADGDIALTMLVSGGPWRQRVWREGTNDSIEVLLTAPGDYIAWGTGRKGDCFMHHWQADGESTMLTVRWRFQEQAKKGE